MNLLSIRLITTDITRLITFYERVTGIPAKKYTDDFAEIQSPNATLAIGSVRTMQLFGDAQLAQTAKNGAVIIEFISKDVDLEYERLSTFLEPYIVQKPVTMPWGNRSLLFRDPDGNLVNFFTPVSSEAIRKFEGKL